MRSAGVSIAGTWSQQVAFGYDLHALMYAAFAVLPLFLIGWFGSNRAVKSTQDAAYRALINLSSDYLGSQGRRHRLVPGMQVNAEIHLGTRSFYRFFKDDVLSTSPIQTVAERGMTA